MPATLLDVRRADAAKPSRNLLDYATDAEGEALATCGRAMEDALGEIGRIKARQNEIERTLTAAAAVRVTSWRAAAARAMGEAAPLSTTPVAAPVDRGELEAQAAALRLRMLEAEAERDRVKAQIRVAVMAIARRAAEQDLAPAYLKAADDLALHFELLSSAFQVLADGGERGFVAQGGETWMKLLVPGLDRVHSARISARSHEVWGIPVICAGEELVSRGGPRAAVMRFADAVKAITGGHWPFK